MCRLQPRTTQCRQLAVPCRVAPAVRRARPADPIPVPVIAPLRRRFLLSLGIGSIIVPCVLHTSPAVAEYRIESLIPDDISFGVVKDPILAYEFLYPKQYLSNAPLAIDFYRKPIRYTLAAPQSVEGRQHIVCGLGAFDKGVVVTVSVGPPPQSMGLDVSNWTARSVANGVLSDQSVSRQSGNQRVPISSIENLQTEERNGLPYWSYESILTGAPTSTNRSKETYRHSLNVTSLRDGAEGTPFLYTLSLSCPQDQWENLSPLFDLCGTSFRLTPPTSGYVPPDRSDFFLF